MAKKKTLKGSKKSTVSAKKTEKPSKKSSKKSTIAAKKQSKPERKKSAQKPKPSSKPSGAYFPIICVDCYHEYHIHQNTSAKTIVCPACGHQAPTPEAEFFAKYSIHKAKEKRSLLLGVVGILLLIGAFIAWMVLLTDPRNAANSTLNYGLGFGMFVGFVLCIIGIVKYEKSIMLAYF
ncbi:MAG: hypothetical protein D6805_10375 [Planctomycetota bacterium]|nr:MAG: hypothetical protein D6805_10375 [Planctomycetota bacterium]